MKTKQFSVRARANSFRFAGEGIIRFFREEHNAWIHLAATITVLGLALLLKVSSGEAIGLVIVIGMVWVAEIINTAIEKIANLVSPGYHPEVKLIKDLAAAAVLTASAIALITGAIIFIPKIF